MINDFHWFSRNAGIAYPVDETATTVDDGGIALPPNILVDAKLSVPRSAGDRVFVSSVVVTPRAVAVTFSAERDGSTVPVAALTLPQPVAAGRCLAVTPLLDGAGGWIAFGDGVAGDPVSLRFSGPSQALLAPRAAHLYRPPGVSSLRSLDSAAALTGIVRLSAQPPLSLRMEDREIDGVSAACLVVGLDEEETVETEGAAVRSVLREFAGPCGGRPDSRSCEDPKPIEFLQGVGPDCDGVLTIVLRGCASLGRLQDGSGVFIDCAVGAADACIPPYIADESGSLPDDYPPPARPVIPEISESEGDETSESESQATDGLPFDACCDGAVVPAGLVGIAGSWTATMDEVYDDESPCPIGPTVSLTSVSVDYPEVPCIRSASPAFRSLLVWQDDTTTRNRTATARFRLRIASGFVSQRAGVAIDVRPLPGFPTKHSYWLAEVDYATQSLSIASMSGSNRVDVLRAAYPNIRLDRWYDLVFRTRVSGNAVELRAELRNDEGTQLASIGPYRTSLYGDGDGWIGISAGSTGTSFSHFRVEGNN